MAGLLDSIAWYKLINGGEEWESGSGEEWESGSGEEWERGAMIAGAESKNHLIEGGCLTDQLYEYICYKLIFSQIWRIWVKKMGEGRSGSDKWEGFG